MEILKFIFSREYRAKVVNAFTEEVISLCYEAEKSIFELYSHNEENIDDIEKAS
ncbi:hypothetical protein [Thermoanaerobacterium thermosaccharolyticum]|uniref:Uncharacterized protein n=1 Tax=Thermoanaerobacterium thermosaccharolyticum M0795 TaxID=698948 RepID=L0IH26_THETR|nr:hypothetical protein [Thermoanaerobacterium thermosaccharolyticum]AGB18069.1 hypothetical protein Thethe_00341 [Thermoanaerobacterium thermosaccharolyticum M0795]